MINVAGHRIGITEVESALASHPKVAEAAVVSKPHVIKGQSLVAHVVLKTSQHRSDSLKVELRQYVRKGSARSRRSTISSSRTSSRRRGAGRSCAA